MHVENGTTIEEEEVCTDIIYGDRRGEGAQLKPASAVLHR